ncbi:hypothetical protein ACXYMU_00130 [Pontibacter sp. CAU 1760]
MTTPESSSKPHLLRADALLLLLYVLLAAIICFRVNVEATGYTTPDSEAYLGLAQNMLDGHGFYVLKADGTRAYFSTWPVGYPVLIYLVSSMLPLSVFWASKVLNLVLLGLGFLLFRCLNRRYAFIMASVYSAYTFLDIYSFTWSEAPFLLGLLCLCVVAAQTLQHAKAKHLLLLFLVCAFLFLMRYVGAFSFAVPALLGIYFYFKGDKRAAAKLLLTSILLTILAGTYLYLNYRLSGFMTGFDRLEASTEPTRTFVGMMIEGLLNELLLVRKYRLGNQPDYLLYFTVVLQLLAMAAILMKVEKLPRLNLFSQTCLFVASLYLLTVALLRSISHFDDLDYRLLAPFSFLFWVGLMHYLVALPDHAKGNVQAKYIAFAFFLVSLLLNMPKQYILDGIRQLLP